MILEPVYDSPVEGAIAEPHAGIYSQIPRVYYY